MNKVVTFKQVSLYTESFGNPDNPAILLIMGAASSMIWWEPPFCELLADRGFFVIRYDNRDTGKSTCYPPGKPEYTFEELADDAIHVLDSYKISKAIIMGMSMGGMLTQMIALRHPERVCGIVLLSSMYFAAGAENLPYSSEEVNNFFATFGQKEDVVIPYIHGEMLAGTIPDAVLYTMEGAGHELNQQDYIPVAEQIVNRFAL